MTIHLISLKTAGTYHSVIKMNDGYHLKNMSTLLKYWTKNISNKQHWKSYTYIHLQNILTPLICSPLPLLAHHKWTQLINSCYFHSLFFFLLTLVHSLIYLLEDSQTVRWQWLNLLLLSSSNLSWGTVKNYLLAYNANVYVIYRQHFKSQI